MMKGKDRFPFKSFIQQLPIAIAIFDKDLNYIIASERWAHETTLDVKEIIGKNIYAVVPDIPTKWKKIHQRALNGECLNAEEDVFKRSDGSREWWRWKIAPWYMPNNAVGGIILFVEQITARKLLEMKMKGMINALNQSNADLERFAHICAHDLNEPLRAIAHYGQLLDQALRHQFDPIAKGYMDHIMKSIKHAEALVDGILTYSQLGAAGIKKSFFSLDHVLNALLTILENKIKEKNAFIYSDKLPVVYGDKTLLSVVLQNILNNALKFNKTDPTIIYITVKERKTSFLFCIEDNGIGIDTPHHQKIFELFKRLHQPSEYEGTGTGLSISKKIIEAHGGKIWVKSIPHEGAQFFFTLPKKSKRE
jgi:PAS domain S-box-containing protein